MGALDLARARYKLLLSQLLKEESQRSIAKRLGISQGQVSFVVRGDREPGMDAITEAMDRLHLRSAFFFDESLVDPQWKDFIAHTHIEDVWVDYEAWIALEQSGGVDEFRRAGLPEEVIQRIRRWPWRGTPEPRDYERLLEAAQLGNRPTPAEELEEARERRKAAGKPKVPLRPKKTAE